MKIVSIEAKTVFGIKTRTTNKDEMNPETAKIGATWQKFDSRVDVDYKGGERVYGVYYNYESDANGAFDILAGYETPNSQLDRVEIQEGKYLLFSKTFEATDNKTRIAAVIETWGRVWEYFSDDNSEYKRAFTTDFEYYKNQHEIEIYISIA